MLESEHTVDPEEERMREAGIMPWLGSAWLGPRGRGDVGMGVSQNDIGLIIVTHIVLSCVGTYISISP